MLCQGLLQALPNKLAQGRWLFGTAVPGIGQTKTRYSIQAVAPHWKRQAQATIGQVLALLVHMEGVTFADPSGLIRIEHQAHGGKASTAHHIAFAETD